MGCIRSTLCRAPSRARHTHAHSPRTYDWQCNSVANKLWVDKLDWTGKEAYGAADWGVWVSGGKIAGETKKARYLTFATVRGAGHMMSIVSTCSYIKLLTFLSTSKSHTVNLRSHRRFYRGGWRNRIFKFLLQLLRMSILLSVQKPDRRRDEQGRALASCSSPS